MTRQRMLKVDGNMEKVLDAFDANDGCATTGYLVDESGLSRPTVTKRLDRLHAAECVVYAHESTALWRLVDDPREDGDD